MGAPPLVAPGVELVGEYEGSGFKEPVSLARLADGQMIQLPPLLYSVLEKSDGRRTVDEIAREVGSEIRRGIDGDQVQFLVDQKLRPLGVLAEADGSAPVTETTDPMLALKFRMGVVPASVSNFLGALLRPLFFGAIVVAVLAAFVAADAWVFFQHGVAQSIRQSMFHPALFLPLFGAIVVGAAFHEMGHAAACRYGGGTPGKMGCGLYLAWPAFYTDVTDAYRLGRAARLRTDLGGIYFNIVIVVATVGAYLLTGFEPLLLLVVVQHFEIAHQLLPVVRLDGYYIVADLTGVPDLFARIGPILRSVLPWRATEPEVSALKRWVRVAVTLWVLIVVPLLLFELLVVLVHLPRILATGWASGSGLWDTAQGAFADGRALEGIAGVLQIIVLTLPIVGILLVLFKTATGLAGGVWRFTQGRPVVRTLAVAIGGIGVAALAMAWIPRTNYAPIRPGERGTITETARAVTQLPTRAPVLANEAKAGTATTPSTTTTLPPDATSTTVESSTTSSTDFTTTTSVSGGGSPTTNRSTTSTTAADTTTTPTTAASPTTTAAP